MDLPIENASTEIRTPVLALKGPRPGPLDDGGNGLNSTMGLGEGSTILASLRPSAAISRCGDGPDLAYTAIEHAGF